MPCLSGTHMPAQLLQRLHCPAWHIKASMANVLNNTQQSAMLAASLQHQLNTHFTYIIVSPKCNTCM
jgi:hypothetical protein